MSRTATRLTAIVAVLLLLVFIFLRPPTAKKFRAEDPVGYAACKAFEEAEGAGGKYYHTAIGRAAEYGAEAKEKRIRSAVVTARAGSPVVTSLSDFRRACKKVGYRF